jgi:hypothetical protein
MSNPSESGRGPDQLTRRGTFEDPIGEECLPGDSNKGRSDWYTLKGQELVANPHIDLDSAPSTYGRSEYPGQGATSPHRTKAEGALG